MMLHIVFEYRDKYTNGEWHRQECVMPTVAECMKCYGLGVDCDYRIVSVKEVKDD